MNTSIAYGIALSTLLLLAGHYIRRHFERELEFTTPNVICYGYGTLALWAGVALWLGYAGHFGLAWAILAIDVLSGALVVLLYALDGWLATIKRQERRQKAAWAERLLDGQDTE